LVHAHFLQGDLLLCLLLLWLLLWRLFLQLVRRVRGVIVTAAIVGVPQALPRCRGLRLLLHLVLVIVVGCHSLEKREFRERERVVGLTRESERCSSTIYSCHQ
jgi:uncharacterized membrane protein YccF (DUF307 family)